MLLNQTLGVIVADLFHGDRNAERIRVKRTLELVALALICAVVPVPARLIERLYSLGIYAMLQPVLTSASNLSPIALMDFLILVVVGAWIVLASLDLMRAARAGWVRSAGRIVFRTLTWFAA